MTEQQQQAPEPIIVEIEGVGELEFPAGTADAVIDASVKKMMASHKPVEEPPQGAFGLLEKATSIGPMTTKARVNTMLGDPGPMGNVLRSAQSGGITSGGGAPTVIPELFKRIGRRFYQGALKPPRTITKTVPGGADAVVETGLEEGLTVSRRGLDKAEGIIDSLDDQVEATLKGSTKTIPRQAVSSRLKDTVGDFRHQVNPLTDLRSIAKVGREFRQTNPADIPIHDAQLIKQGTYRAQRKKYGQQGAAEVEAEKGLARGLKEEISAAEPTVAPLNARSSAVIPVKDAIFDAVQRSSNNNTVGLGDVVAMSRSPRLLAATLGMRAPVQSTAGRIMYRTGQAIPVEEMDAAIRALIMGSQQR